MRKLFVNFRVDNILYNASIIGSYNFDINSRDFIIDNSVALCIQQYKKDYNIKGKVDINTVEYAIDEQDKHLYEVKLTPWTPKTNSRYLFNI